MLKFYMSNESYLLGYVTKNSSELIVVFEIQVFELSQVWNGACWVSCSDPVSIFEWTHTTGDFWWNEKTYGDDALSYDLVKRWHREFKHGRKSVETAPRPGRPPSAIDDASVRQVEAAILEDRRITIRQIAQEVKISSGSVETIIHDHLHMHKVSARWIPRLLTPFQKQERVECSKMNLEMCQADESQFFKRLITQDETWVHHYDPETKVQSMQWKHFASPPPKKARVQPSAGKVMLTVFWDQDGVVMTDFLA